LTYKPHNLSMTVAGAAVTIGIENIDGDETAFDYMVNYQEKTVRCSSVTSPPAVGEALEFTYQYDAPVIAIRKDQASQTAIAAIMGGDGIFEHSITDSQLDSLEAAEAAAEADLRLHANPLVNGSFVSYTDGWAPGQIVNITAEGIAGVDFTVQKVTITPYTPGAWQYKVSFGGRILGLETVLAVLLGKREAVENTEVLNKIDSESDTATAADVLTSSTHAVDWCYDDADAFFDFVELA
jgi:hypothetical protein